MSWFSLPTETRDLILDEFSDKHVLLPLILTCKTLRDQLEPKLYERVTFSGLEFETSVHLFHRTIVTRNSQHASRVHSFILINSLRGTHPKFHITVQCIDQILERLCNLTALFISHDPVWGNDLQEQLFFPCLTRTPSPFQLEHLVWDQRIDMGEGFHCFLSQQHSVTDLTLLPHLSSIWNPILPPQYEFTTAITHINSVTGSLDCLHIFPPNHITAFRLLDSAHPYFRSQGQFIVNAFSRLRAFSCRADADMMNLIVVGAQVTDNETSVMPNLEFLEFKNWMSLNHWTQLSVLSKRPVRYLRLPLRGLQPSICGPEQLFTHISTLECVDYVDDTKYWPIIHSQFTDHFKVLMDCHGEVSVPKLCNRWRRGATSAVIITLPPRLLEDWELDLHETE